MVGLTELASTDPAATRRFLEKVFDWNFDNLRMPQGEYFAHSTTQGSGVGIRSTRTNESPASVNYVLVSDLVEAERKVRNSGGEIVLPRTDIPGMGSFFWFKAPGGPVMACWQDSNRRADTSH
jgi:uncharacterized protein